MLAVTQTEGFRRALIPVIACVLGAGLLAVTLGIGAGDANVGIGRAGLADKVGESSSAPGGGDPAQPLPDGNGPEPSAAPEPLGPGAVPAPGVYRYDVDAVRDGVFSTTVEEREIAVLGQEGASSIVQVVARSDDERQISVLDWSPKGVLVRSTRIETTDGASRDCTWDPAFAEFGALAAGAEWSLESTCETDVAGLPTTFVVSGTGRVTREAAVAHGGINVRVWQVVRDRTTTISAKVGADDIEQVIREVGTFFIDPVRGLVLRSDVTVTISGAQEGMTRRTSVLTEG